MNDLISRQAVLDAIDSHKYSDSFCEEHNIDWSINLGMVHILVNELPSVQPKMGHWELDEHLDKIGMIYKYMCSECGANHRAMYDYCPSCGSHNGGDADANSD